MPLRRQFCATLLVDRDFFSWDTKIIEKNLSKKVINWTLQKFQTFTY